MTPQERILTEDAATRLLGTRTKGAVLTALLAANGRIMTRDDVASVPPRRHDWSDDLRNLAKVRICLVRAALNDVGLDDVIETVWATGYRITLADRARVMAALAEFAP